MKIDFITLSESGKQSKVWEPVTYIPLLWPTIAALTPPHIRFNVQDEHFVPINTNMDSDLAAITISTSVATRAYALGSELKAKGKKVIYGGPHITNIVNYPEFKDEPFKYGGADSIFVGETESIWTQFIEDLSSKKNKEIYIGSNFKFDKKIIPKREIIRQKGFAGIIPPLVSIESSRGCPGSCSFCSSNGEYRVKPLDDLIEEIESLPNRYIQFIDSNMGADKKRFEHILNYFKSKQLIWSASFYLPTLTKEIINDLANSGCTYVYVGFESVNAESLAETKKSFNDITKYKSVITQLHDKGIGVVGSFVFGFDNDKKSVFEKTNKFINDMKLDDASFHILTPYPGTPLFDRLRLENRLLYNNFPNDWGHFNRNEVAFNPKNMSPLELKEGYEQSIKSFYSASSIYQRLISNRQFSKNLLFGIIANGVKHIRYN